MESDLTAFKPGLWDGSDPTYAPCTSRSKSWLYWRAPARYRALGYAVTTMRLPGEIGDGLDIERAAKAQELTREMVRWAEGRETPRIQPNTWGWLIAHYKSDDISPFREIKSNSREGYMYAISRWEDSIGAMLVSDTDLATLKRWHNAMKENGRSISHMARMFRILRIITNYGVALRVPGARDVSDTLRVMRIKAPKARTSSPTPEQISAIIASADAAGDKAFALGLMLQWWLTLRAVDVRGHYLTISPSDAKDAGGIVRRSPSYRGNPGRISRWADGMTWDMIDREVKVLRKTPSKTEDKLTEVLEFDLTLVPELRERLLAIPLEDRVGPVIKDKRGLPYDIRAWSQMFRNHRTACGIPEDIWMMDTRAGAINHARRMGASPIQMRAQANHAQQATTDRYVRERSDDIATVIQLRRSNGDATG